MAQLEVSQDKGIQPLSLCLQGLCRYSVQQRRATITEGHYLIAFLRTRKECPRIALWVGVYFLMALIALTVNQKQTNASQRNSLWNLDNPFDLNWRWILQQRILPVLRFFRALLSFCSMTSQDTSSDPPLRFLGTTECQRYLSPSYWRMCCGFLQRAIVICHWL